jgi:chaperonin GroES
MALKPIDDRIVIERLESEDKSEGGIYLPDTAKEKPQKGKIVAVGSGKVLDSGERKEMSVAKGDTILFGKYSGTEIKIDGDEYIVMRESEILAKIIE